MSEIELYKTAVAGISSIDDVMKYLRSSHAVVDVVNTVLAPAAVITDDEKAALAKLPKVFGSVVPSTRRDLKAEEIAKLHEERRTLDVLEKMVEERKKALRTTILNALDVRHEHAFTAGLPKNEDEQPFDAEAYADDTPRDKDGHYIKKAIIDVPGSHERFSWEVSSGQVNVDVEALRSVADDEDVNEIDHQDYLEVTTPIRVLDEAKFMAKLKEKPELLRLAPKFVTQGSPRGALYLRKQK